MLGALTACGASSAPARGALHYTEDAQRAYEKAMVAFNDHDWEEAKLLFKDVKKKYGYSRYARLAELRIADVDFASEKLAEAIQGYRSYVHDHRTDRRDSLRPLSHLQGALRSDLGRRLFAPPQEERDQGTTMETYRELTSLVKDFPAGPYATQSRYMLSVVTGRLVRHELYVARFYLRRDAFTAAVSRTQFALRTYSGSGIEPEAMVLLGETYLKMHKPADARSSFSQVVAQYPSSAFSTAAKNFLLEMDSQGK